MSDYLSMNVGESRFFEFSVAPFMNPNDVLESVESVTATGRTGDPVLAITDVRRTDEPDSNDQQDQQKVIYFRVDGASAQAEYRLEIRFTTGAPRGEETGEQLIVRTGLVVTASPLAEIILSPWPASDLLATHVLRDLVGAESGEVSNDRLARLGKMAAARVQEFAPDAPLEVKNESVVRLTGYQIESNFGALRSETTGPLSQDFVSGHGMAFRRCGAMALLGPWKVRRAGVIG